MNYQKEEFESKKFDQLAIMAGIVDEIGIVEKMNEIFLVDSREKVNKGEIVKVIILNEPGSVWRPLNSFPKFFEKKAIEYLLGAGIEGEDLNNDKIGRVIDKPYKLSYTNID
jgi:transposase